MMSNNFGKNHLENLTKLRNRQKASISIQSQVPLSSRRGYFFSFFFLRKEKSASYFEAPIVLSRALTFPPPMS